jgi:hypothetical protein
MGGPAGASSDATNTTGSMSATPSAATTGTTTK